MSAILAPERLDAAAGEAFLVHEARLLDEGRFDEWLALFTQDAWYWVPAQANQPDPRDHISLIYDDRRLLETRVRRLTGPRLYSQEPRSRTSRMIGNVTVEESDASGTTLRAKFQLVEFRRDRQILYAGTTWHRLVALDGALRIASKRIDLVNCDGSLEGLVVPF